MKALLSTLFFLWSSSAAYAQVCGGNLGENIFTAGDFGSGTANLVAQDPGIAPGYQYTTNVPPPDGFYTITNNTALWPNLYGSWLGIPDNSPDPQGYMMVVNASFTPGLFYEQQVDGLCENTLYVFTSDMINLIRQGAQPPHNDPNISFLINGEEQYTTGDIPKTESWRTYGFTFTTQPGQTSVTLSLRNNAPGGIGNDVALDNISFRACGPLAQILPETVKRICEDGQFTDLTATINGDQYPTPAIQWQRSLDAGATWEDIPGETDPTFTHTELSSGFYYYRYLLANGPTNLASAKCRVVSNEKIVEVVPKLWTAADTICTGLTYVTGNSSYTESGTYVDTLLSSLGCDSIVTLELFVVPDPDLQVQLDLSHPACTGDRGTLTVVATSNGTPPYRYALADGEPGTTSQFSDLPPGDYPLRVIDRFGCNATVTATIIQPVDFRIDLGEDREVRLGETVELRPVATAPVATYTWTPPPPDCDPDCAEPVLLPTDTRRYTLVATSDAGCVATDSVRIVVLDVREVYLPNAFSPNDDGVNDRFLPFANTPNVQRIERLRVFDRWGALVYEESDFAPNATSNGWDGSARGEPAATGIYTYVVEVLFLDEAVITFGGEVLLTR